MLSNTESDASFETRLHARKKMSTKAGRTTEIFSLRDLDRSHWSPLRHWLDKKLSSQACETAVGIVIVLNVIIIIVEADVNAECAAETIDTAQCNRLWLVIISNFFLGLYTIEALIKFFVYRLHVFESKWIMFDIFIVFVGYLDVGLSHVDGSTLPAMQMMRIFRVARLMRGIRLMRFIPELYSMVRGFASAMKAMFWGFMMIILLLMIFAIFAVEMIYPVAITTFGEDEWCREAFSSVTRSVLYFFQTLVAGDSWGECAIPVVTRSPLAFSIYAGALVSVQLGFTNLILAVIVEKAAAAHEEDVANGIKEREKQKEIAAAMVNDVCESIDSDGSGRVTLEELMNGYDNEDRLRQALLMLDIQRGDLGDLFHLMDMDGSGDLTYEEITNCIHRADTTDVRRQIMFVKLHVSRLENKLQEVVEITTGRRRSMVQRTPPSFSSEIEDLPPDGKNNACSIACQALEHTLERYIQRMDEQIATFAEHVVAKPRAIAIPMSTTENIDSSGKPWCADAQTSKFLVGVQSLDAKASSYSNRGYTSDFLLRHVLTPGPQLGTMAEVNVSPRVLNWEQPQAQWGASAWDEANMCESECMKVPLPSKLVNQGASPTLRTS